MKKQRKKITKPRLQQLDNGFIFFQKLPRAIKYTIGTTSACVGVVSLTLPIVPGRLLLLTSFSIFAPTRYLKYVGFRYRSVQFLEIINDHQNNIEHNLQTTPKIIRKSLKLKVKKRIQ